MRTNLMDFQWCPWCGNFSVFMALKQALFELSIPAKDTVFVTWIGCNSKMSQYLDTYGAETLHGRWLAFATGVKLANPQLTVISLSWDGDSYGIGLNHLLQTARRNLKILHITCDNRTYALTVNQASPTTLQWKITQSTPQGNPFSPFVPLDLVKSAWGRWVKETTSTNIPEMKSLMKEALQFDGFSHLHISQFCPSWGDKELVS